MTPLRPAWRAHRRAAAVSTAALVISLLLPHAVAAAEPDSLDRQIQHRSEQLEKVVERFNELRDDLRITKAQSSVLRRQIEPLQEEIQRRREVVGRLASIGFRNNRADPVNALLDASTTREVLDRLLIMESFAQQQQREIEALTLTSERYESARRTLTALIEQQRAQHKELTERRAVIEKSIAELNDLRRRAGSPGGRVESPVQVALIQPKNGGSAETIVRYALRQLGKSYRWASAGPHGFDCSGLVKAAFSTAGIELPHQSARQRQRSKRISRAELRPGDLVFFYRDLHHVGIYVGEGKMVHSPQHGEQVRVDLIDSLPVHSYGRVLAR